MSNHKLVVFERFAPKYNCRRCGVKFIPGHGNQKYCNSCTVAPSLGKTISKKCEQCGSYFSTTRPKTKYCSKACGLAYRSGRHYLFSQFLEGRVPWSKLPEYAAPHMQDSGYVRLAVALVERETIPVEEAITIAESASMPAFRNLCARLRKFGIDTQICKPNVVLVRLLRVQEKDN